MPSFDVISEINWQDMDDAINQALKEITTRFDFKGVKVAIEMDPKAKTVKITTSEAYKLDAIQETFHKRLVKRGVPLLALDYEPEEKTGSGAKLLAKVAAGVSKEKGKEIIAAIKDIKKVQAQIQDEKVRVSGKNRDDLQEAIAVLKEKESKIGVPLRFGNFRE
jgi:uncharacterized protein YajQ (UPF0234 family)